MRRWRLLAVLVLGAAVGAAALGTAWYLTSGNDQSEPEAAQASVDTTFYGGWQARRKVGPKGMIAPDEDSQCALAVHPGLARELIICWSLNYYQCYEPDPDHAKDDPDWWTENQAGWDGPPNDPGECSLARDSLRDEGMLPVG